MADAKAAYFYDTLAAALKENDTPDYVTLDPSKGLTQTEVLNGLELFVCDNPEYFWLIRGGRISTRADGTVVTEARMETAREAPPCTDAHGC